MKVSYEFTNLLRVVFSIILISSFLAEMVLSSSWNKVYFTCGLLVFIKRISVELPYNSLSLFSHLEAQSRSSSASSLVFQEIEPYSYAFRERFFEYRPYTPVMHGVLFFDRLNNEVVVKGFANWSVLVFSLIWLGSAVYIGLIGFPESTLFALALIGFFALLMGVSYRVQHSRFSRVAAVAAQECKKKRTINTVGA